MTRTRYHSFVDDSARWEGFAFRDDDIVISTPAKCGTTWMQMLCAELIFGTTDLPAPLATLSPWLDMQTRPIEEVRADLDAQSHRRFIKTHTPLDGLPWDPRVTYLHVTRDPRDVALSWDNHLANTDMDRMIGTRLEAVGADDLDELGLDLSAPPEQPEDPGERFWAWMAEPVDSISVGGLGRLARHITTFWGARHEPNVHLFHYADLQVDLAGEMARLSEVLGVEPPTDEMVEAATFSQMKCRADRLVPNADTPFWHDNSQFFDRARSGAWRDLLDDAVLERYHAAVAEVLPADALDWVHHAWRGAGAQEPGRASSRR